MKHQGKALLAAIGCAFAISAQAAVIAQNSFDAGAEGWTVGDFFAATGAASPTFVAAGGNPGGFIRTTDLFGWNAYHAPAAYLGNQSAAYGGHLLLDQQIVSSDGLDYPMVVISDGTLMLQFRTTPPGTNWTHYDIRLLASAGWEVANGSGLAGPAASEAQLQQVLGNLQFLNIDADWLSGSDQVDLDNVCLEGPRGGRTSACLAPANNVPEPAPLGLLALGLTSALIARRVRRGQG
jgi:hypothetical protein